MDSDKCGEVYAYAWDGRGSFVCHLPPGHEGDHETKITKARPESIYWRQTGGKA